MRQTGAAKNLWHILVVLQRSGGRVKHRTHTIHIFLYHILYKYIQLHGCCTVSIKLKTWLHETMKKPLEGLQLPEASALKKKTIDFYVVPKDYHWHHRVHRKNNETFRTLEGWEHMQYCIYLVIIFWFALCISKTLVILESNSIATQYSRHCKKIQLLLLPILPMTSNDLFLWQPGMPHRRACQPWAHSKWWPHRLSSEMCRFYTDSIASVCIVLDDRHVHNILHN